MSDLIPWWSTYGSVIPLGELRTPRAQGFVRYIERAVTGVATIVEARCEAGGDEAVLVEVQTFRPQMPAIPLLSSEPVAFRFGHGDARQPGVHPLRPDFPRTTHQSWAPRGYPSALCIDDRPWAEARRTWTPAETLQRTMRWFERAGMGELHDVGQPLDPFFFGAAWRLVLPKAAFDGADGQTEIFACQRDPRSRVVIASMDGSTVSPNGGIAVSFIGYAPPPAPMGVMKNCPLKIAELDEELKPLGIDLLADLSKCNFLRADGKASRLNSRLGIMVRMTVTDPNGNPARREDPYVFWTSVSIGQIGVALGKLYLDGKGGFLPKFDGLDEKTISNVLGKVSIEPAIVQSEFTRENAATIAGRNRTDDRKVVLVGAGAIGSMMAETLVREGRFSWDIFDPDVLLPHNVARHTLSRDEVGVGKAHALAARLPKLADGTVANGHAIDILDPGQTTFVESKVAEADIIVDASASISAARALCDMTGDARRASAFFNPAGADVVVLVEDAARSVDLRSLEAAYYRAVLTVPELGDHLTKSSGELRYSGSCREVTNRIPASRAQTLSAIAAGAISQALDAVEAMAAVWRLKEDGAVERLTVDTTPPARHSVGDWSVLLPRAVQEFLRSSRRLALPAETGGVVLGVIDIEAKRIDIVDVLSAPRDSRGTPTRFERGVAGLKEAVFAAQAKTVDQIRYVGEWHSHPDGAGALPSRIDLEQIAWLADTLSEDGFPGLMLIVGDDEIRALLGAVIEPDANDGSAQ